MTRRRKLTVGDWVEVRNKEEILRSLDSNGQLDGMPFMPEMLQFCGKRFQVFKRAHKTYDPDYQGRRIDRTVHLEMRCDGSEHGGCQAQCLIFWKEAWLKPIGRYALSGAGSGIEPHSEDTGAAATGGCSESDVWKRAQTSDADGGTPTYVCQATQVPYAGEILKWWDIRQYIEDYSSGNVGLWRLFSGFVYSMYYNLSQSGIGLGPAMRWFYDAAHPLWRGSRWPRMAGSIPEGQSTPAGALNLQPGELVRVKSHQEILRTVNTGSRNRGLWWDAEMVPYTGGAFRVLSRVTRIIDEKTGKMQEMKNPCIILDSVVDNALYSARRMFCPRSAYAYWREIWLERIEPDVSDSGQVSSGLATR